MCNQVKKSLFRDILRSGFLLILFVSYTVPILAKDGRQIMQGVRKQARKHKTTETDVYMKITNASGKKRERYFANKKKLKGENISNSIIKFYKPASVKGTGLLTVSNEKKTSSKQWVYLPALRSLRQLSSDDKNKSFMGSDFTNGDIAGRELDRDAHKYVKTKGNYDYVVSVPKDKEDPYSKLMIKVHNKKHVVLEVVFYNRKGEKMKVLENKKIKKIKGMYMIIESLMTNHLTKGKTSLKVSGVKVGHRISDNSVGIKGLRK